MTAHLVMLRSEADLGEWRDHARRLIEAGIVPSGVVWQVGNHSGDLFAGNESSPGKPAPAPSTAFSVPRAFIELATQVICHSSAERFALLYRLLWRLRSGRHLLDDATDPDVHRAHDLAKAVRRDKHKMTAFVRFREVATDDGSIWIAWFEPQHHIVAATAPFFVRRFTGMRWSILTPRLSAHWDGNDLSFSAGATKADAPSEDALEEHWRIYFAAIFNPARLNVSAMQREMPKRYWKNMPETSLIPDLVRTASARTTAMISSPPPAPRFAASRGQMAHLPLRPSATSDAQGTLHSLPDLNDRLAACRRCPLWQPATQVVCGKGPHQAEIMLVGEQPGDHEDLVGEPFVGPAGKLLDSALQEAQLPRTSLYLTNAVKHFKFEPRGKRRLHKKPNAPEIDVCRWWLAREIRLVAPKLIVALGATAASSLLQRPVAVTAERGTGASLSDGTPVVITVHPSYLLRLPDPTVAADEHRRFVSDLRSARQLAADLTQNSGLAHHHSNRAVAG